ALVDARSTPLCMFVLGAERQPAVSDRVEDEPERVVGGRLENAMTTFFLKAGEADASRCATPGQEFEIGVERMARHAERLGTHGTWQVRRRVVIGNHLRRGEDRRAIVVVVAA